MKTPFLLRLLLYTWASPTTLVGLVAGLLTLCTGGSVQRRRGTLVIIGRDPLCLEFCRNHEQAHVRQVERWGVAFIPAYLLASLLAWWQGGHYYFDNWFERDARRACGESD
jgi:hypothetical protein